MANGKTKVILFNKKYEKTIKEVPIMVDLLDNNTPKLPQILLSENKFYINNGNWIDGKAIYKEVLGSVLD